MLGLGSLLESVVRRCDLSKEYKVSLEELDEGTAERFKTLLRRP